MFTAKTYENILNSLLSRVPNDIDKREGSVIHTALAPAAMELAEIYVNIEELLSLLFPDTATGEYLERITAQFGVERNRATYAIRKATFYNGESLLDVPINSRLAIDSVIYSVTEKIDTGIYKLTCETAGTIGNTKFGNMLVIDYIPNLSKAILSDILVPGEDTETDEELRTRFYEYATQPAFAGNIIDYTLKTKEIDGVGAVKVIPIWNGGGTVKLIILDSTLNSPSDTLVNTVQQMMGNEGDGIAPIGHIVTVIPAEKENINITTNILIEEGFTLENLQEQIESAINDYFAELKSEWENTTLLIVRIAHIESRILNVTGVQDISNTLINGATENVTISNEKIPYLQSCILSEVVLSE